MRYYVKFCFSHGINDPCLPDIPQDQRNFSMAMYAQHLIDGNNLACLTIKTGTVRFYMKAAADLCKPRRLISPSISVDRNKSDWVESVLKGHKRWKEMPNRQEPVTTDMV